LFNTGLVLNLIIALGGNPSVSVFKKWFTGYGKKRPALPQPPADFREIVGVTEIKTPTENQLDI